MRGKFRPNEGNSPIETSGAHSALLPFIHWNYCARARSTLKEEGERRKKDEMKVFWR